ncbi:Hemicentin-1 [Portunus trituberculatus]|uniref:Hemicentin-1 n=1 Tax=Portunus trituberculatus TaxID=210409 RepID=A0A5B7CKH1_PORTR|nr:Hemicentin-1 [Portunus trituberculatus]
MRPSIEGVKGVLRPTGSMGLEDQEQLTRLTYSICGYKLQPALSGGCGISRENTVVFVNTSQPYLGGWLAGSLTSSSPEEGNRFRSFHHTYMKIHEPRMPLARCGESRYQACPSSPRLHPHTCSLTDKAHFTTLPFRASPLATSMLKEAAELEEVGPVTATTDPERFQESLKESYIFGGGDCPEMAIKAIRIALDISLPHSYVYVFTDARAKDYYLLDEVLQIIQKKQSQVVFVMTGDCGNHTHPGYQAFEDIASTSSGQIFHLDKGNVKESFEELFEPFKTSRETRSCRSTQLCHHQNLLTLVLDFVRVSLESRKVNLLSFNREDFGPGEENIPLLIDPTLKQFTISVSGEKPKIEIYDAAGRYIKEEEGVEHLLDLENVKIVGVKQPSPGQYNISVGSESKFTVRATGVSSLSFDHGFSLYPTTDFKETYHRPMTGETSYVLVKPSDVTEFGDLIRLQMISLDGRILEDLPLTRLPGSLPVYNGTAFLTPDQPFNLKIFGRDKHGYEFERISSTAVSSQEPSLPEVNSLNEVTGYTSRPAIITCHVHTLLPFTLLWQKNGLYIGTEQSYPQSSEVHYIVNSASQEDEGQYTCIANNSVGTASSDVYLDVKEPPPHVVASKTVTVFSTQPAVLTCHVTSAVEYNITWSRYVEKGQIKDFFGKTETIGDFVSVDELEGYQVLANDSLVLERPSSQHEGWFRCTAANEGGRQSREVHVTVQSLPEVTVLPEVLGYRRGDNITLSCLGQGLPHPILTWSRDDVSLTESTDGSASQIELHVSLATRDDEGMYTCTASSSSGTATAVSTLRYTEAPQVVPFEEELFVRNGETMEDDYLKILGVQENDAGQYTCRATNWAGADEAQISLRVGAAPTVIQAPTDAELDIGSMGGFSCYGVGVPEPSITWYKADGSYLPSHFAQDGDGNLRIKVAPVVAVPQVPHLEVTKGSAVTLPCIVVMADPPPQITWYYEGSPIYSGTGDMVIDDDGSLKIPVVKSKDEGRYQCVATNVAGNSSLTLTLSVLVPPRAKNNRGEENIVVLKGDVVRLKCPVKADPKPTFSWTKDGQPLPFDSRRVRVSKKNGIIMIKQARQSDAGTYVCIAKNAAGTTSIPVNLQVNDEPEISPAGDEILTVLAGQDLKLPCEVTGHPQPYVAWQKDGQSFGETVNLQPGPGYLLMSNVTPSMAAVYTCTAYNSVGEAKKEFTVYMPLLWRRFMSTLQRRGLLKEGSCHFPAMLKRIQYQPKTGAKMDKSYIQHQSRISSPGESGSSGPSGASWAASNCCAVKRSVYHDLYPSGTNCRKFIVVDLQHECTKKSGGDLIISNSGTVEVSHAAPQHSGSYRCTLRNMLGEAHIDYEVEVIVCNEALVSIVQDGVSIHSTKDRADLTHLIIEENGHILHILEVSIADNGTYVCVAKNDAGETEVSYHLEVLVAPRFSQFYHNPEIELRVGQELFLDCHATGNPKPQVSWVHNGSPLEDSVTSSGSQVSVLRVSSSHAGFYTCTVQNTAGTIQRNFNVTVLVPPIFEDNKNHQNNVNAVKGTDTQLDCRVSGSPPPAVSWMKNGLPLAHWPDLQHQLSPDGQVLNLLQVDAHSSGVYRCAAKNSLGTRHKLFNMTVLTPPSIRREDGKADDLVEEIDVVAGEEVILYCPAEGTPRPTITWLKEEKILPSSESPQHLLLYDAQEKDSGDYTCLASNPVGSVEKQFAVRVIVPPHIMQEIDAPLTYVEGEDVSLYCEVEGTTPLSIVWLLDGVGLEDLRLPGITVDEDFTVMEGNLTLAKSVVNIEDVSEIHSGPYTCIASNGAGSDEFIHSVDVATPPRVEDDSTDTNVVVMVNRPAILTCEAESNPEPYISWLKNSEPLEENPNMHVSLDGRELKLLQVREQDTGNYSCLAVNVAGAIFINHTLQVQVPPHLQGEVKENVHAKAGEDVELFCPVYATPQPSILWMNESTILQETFTIINPQRLVLRSVSKDDAGRYSCLATNEAGTLEQDFNLHVMTAPKLVDLEKPVVEKSVVANRLVTVSCYVVADPLPAIRWLKDGKPLPSTSTVDLKFDNQDRHLTLLRATPADSGNYTCQATNAAGTTTLTTLLSVHTPPTWNPDSDLEEEITALEGENLELFCDVEANPFPSILWLKNGQVISPVLKSNDTEDDRLLRVIKLDDGDSGRYVCVASNAAGTGKFEFEVTVLAHPSLTYEPQTNHTVLQNHLLSLECPVDGSPKPSIQWLINGLPVSSSDKYIQLSAAQTQLHILRVLSSMAGQISCVASNSVGELMTNYTLNVLTPPVITSTPSSRQAKVYEGGLLTLSCHSSGNPRPQVAWLVGDGRMLTESELLDSGLELHEVNQSLIILEANKGHQGHYTCVVSNPAGSAEDTFFVEVLVPPVIREPEGSTSLEVMQSSTITLLCVVDARPRATITWFKDGREIDGRQDPFLHVTGNGEQLKFLRTLSSHTANYTCKAANEAGEDHLNFQVQVMVPPIIIEDLVENAIGGGIGGKTLGVVGRTMDLECYVIGTPTPTVTWTRDIQEIEVNDHLELLEGGQVLRLHHAQTNDSGHYTCTANSTSGTAGRDFLVVIHRRPLITPPSEKNLEVVLNDPLTLTCEVDSSLTPAVSWIRHGQPITPFLNPNFQVRSEGRELHLRRVRKGDGGAFTCVAVNAAGQDTLTYNIAVQVPAVIERANTQSRVIGVAGQSVEFVCEASGSPRPSLSWVHDDTLVTPDHPHYQILDKGKRLQVKEVLLEDEGTISCTASNTAGQDTFNFTLEVMVPPYLPDEAVTDITVKEGDSIILECPVEATPWNIKEKYKTTV